MPTGGKIELQIRFPSTWPWREVSWEALWTVVQWRDLEGDWRDVVGWQGTLDEIAVEDEVDAGKIVTAEKTWWVEETDLGRGPFRWLVYQGQNDRPLATSESFNLPSAAGETMEVELLLGP